MLNVISANKNARILDKKFSLLVRLVQKIVIDGVAVKLRIKKVQNRINFALDDKFKNKLTELGLVPERLWWGPMTLSPVKVEFLIDEIKNRPPSSLLEVGSGTSSAIFAATAEKYKFELLSLENYASTVKYVEYLLKDLSCSDYLTIQVCNFIRREYSNGEKYWWYDANLDYVKKPFDFVLIDGPMGTLVGRNGALPEIIPYLAEDHRIFLDDSTRKHEKSCIDEWRRHYPEIIVEKPSNKCNLAKITIPNIKSIQACLR